ncbi:hypothetical protein ASA1KI_42820 [Opitutales bacterium ASA1]|nr:hypothetical protein ASA1KI_42820 [Opitutales bacterium ASA1]
MHAPRYVSPDLVAGEFTFVNSGCYISANVRLGRYVMFGPDVLIMGGDHRFDLAGVPAYFAGRGEGAMTVIGDDVWVGARALIRCGVRIGTGAIVGMGAVVVKDVERYSIVVGNPARVVGVRFSDEEKAEHDRMLSGAPVRPSFVGDLERHSG